MILDGPELKRLLDEAAGESCEHALYELMASTFDSEQYSSYERECNRFDAVEILEGLQSN